MYANNDPVRLKDPSGNTAEGATVGGYIGGAIAGSLGVESGPFDAGVALGGRYIGRAIGNAVSDAIVSAMSGSSAKPTTTPASSPANSCTTDLDSLSKAAGQPDRNGLTKAGRGLQKHGSRPDSVFDSPGGGDPKVLNPAGQDAVDDILTNPDSQTLPNGGNGIDVIAPDGRGVRYHPDGSFKVLLEPGGK